MEPRRESPPRIAGRRASWAVGRRAPLVVGRRASRVAGRRAARAVGRHTPLVAGRRASRAVSRHASRITDRRRPARRLALVAGLSVALAAVVAVWTPWLSASGAHAALATASSAAESLLPGDLAPPSGDGSAPLAPIALLGLAAAGDPASDVEELVEDVRALRDGRSGVSFGLDRDDELGALADELDGLADAIEERERERREYEAFRDDLLDAIDDVFYVLDKEGAHRQWNRTMAEVTGYSDAELGEMHPLDVFEGEDRERARESMEEGYETGHTRVEAAIATKGGEEIPYEFVASRVEAPDGSPVLAGIGRDVSDRTEYERRLAAVGESVRRLESAESETEIARTVCSIVHEVLEEPNCMLWSYDAGADRLVPVAGTDAAESMAEAVAGDEQLAIEADDPEMALFRAVGTQVIEDYGALEDAAYPDAGLGTVLAVPVDDAGVLAVGFEAVREVDPTTRELVEVLAEHAGASLQRVEREQRLARYKEFTDDVTDAMDDLFYVVDDDLRFQRWNDSLREVTGYADDEIATMDPTEFVVEADRATIGEAIAEVFETGSARAEARVLTKDGEELPYEFDASHLQDPEGNDVLVGIGRDVSERVERERKLEALFENTVDPIYIKDCEGRYQFVNLAAAEYFGQSREDVVGRTDQELFDEAAAEDIRPDDARVLEDGERVTQEASRPIEGEEHVFLDDKFPYRDGDGEIVGVMGISRDVTERVEYERELEARTAAMEATIDGVSILDEDARFVYANQAHADVYGYDDPEAFYGESWRLCYTEDQVDRLEAEVMPELRESGSWRGEVEGQRADGSTFPQELSLTHLEDGRYVCVVRDVTERRRREAELQRTNERLHAIIEASPTALVAIDLEGTVELWNPTAERIFGWSAEEVEGEPVPYVAEEYRAEFEQYLALLADGESVTGVETERVGKDGELVDVNLNVAPLRDADGEVVGAMGALLDVSEQKARQRELERNRALLQQAQRAAAIGGWELDLRTDPPSMTWTDELYDVHGVDRGVEIDPERAMEFYHPADRDRMRRIVEEAIEEGEPHDVEARLDTGADEQRWIRVIGEPVFADGADAADRERDDADREPGERGGADGEGEGDGERGGADGEGEDGGERGSADGEGKDAGERGGADSEGDGRGGESDATSDSREVVALRGSIQDVTDHKRRERELERATDLLQQAQRMGGVGGWEMDVSREPFESIWTDELFRIFDVEPRTPVDFETYVERIHPEERDWVRAEMTRGVASGEPYSLEHRIVTGDGDVRWVRVVAEPVDSGEDLYRGAVLDITEQKEREVVLEALHETARALLEAGSAREVARLAVDASEDVLDAPCVAAYLLDDRTGRLEPVAYSDAFEAACGTPDPSDGGDADSLLWNAYVSEAATTLSESDVDEPGIFSEPIQEAVYVPVGDHGVFVVARPDAAVPPETRRIAETLVATVEAALSRLDSETHLREREAELEAQNRKLRRQIRVNEVIRTVDQSLIGAGSREEIERAVCERLTDAEDVGFAWIGETDATDDALRPRAWAGRGGDYLDAVPLALDADPADPAVRTARTGASAVVESVVQDVKVEEWRKQALVANFSSVVAVPIAYEDYTYGVLAVYGREPGQFDDLERTVFEELGESIASSINAAETRQAIYADTFVELTIRLEGAESFLARIARETGAEVEYVGLGTHSEDVARVFFEVDDDRDAVAATLGDAVAVREYRRIGEHDGRQLFEATVDAEVLAATLVRRGAVPRELTATPDAFTVTVDVSPTMDVREFVETLRETHPSAELVARTDVQRDVETRQELVASMLDALTDRQIEVLRTAYYAGFFGWPRESTGEEIAELLDVSQPTVNRHVRHGLQRLLEQLFEEEPATIEPAT